MSSCIGPLEMLYIAIALARASPLFSSPSFDIWAANSTAFTVESLEPSDFSLETR